MASMQSIISLLDTAIVSGDIKEQRNALYACMNYCIPNHINGLITDQELFQIDDKLKVLAQKLGYEHIK